MGKGTYDDCNPGRIVEKQVKPVMFLAEIKDEEQKVSVLTEELYRYILTISFDIQSTG